MHIQLSCQRRLITLYEYVKMNYFISLNNNITQTNQTKYDILHFNSNKTNAEMWSYLTEYNQATLNT